MHQCALAVIDPIEHYLCIYRKKLKTELSCTYWALLVNKTKCVSYKMKLINEMNLQITTHKLWYEIDKKKNNHSKNLHLWLRRRPSDLFVNNCQLLSARLINEMPSNLWPTICPSMDKQIHWIFVYRRINNIFNVRWIRQNFY